MAILVGILCGLAGSAILIMACEAFAHYMVYGGFIPEGELDAYLGKYFDGLEINEFDTRSKLLTSREMPEFVAMASTTTSKWYINDQGTIPRWSKWSKKLDEKRAELMPIKKKLSEL